MTSTDGLVGQGLSAIPARSRSAHSRSAVARARSATASPRSSAPCVRSTAAWSRPPRPVLCCGHPIFGRRDPVPGRRLPIPRRPLQHRPQANLTGGQRLGLPVAKLRRPVARLGHGLPRQHLYLPPLGQRPVIQELASRASASASRSSATRSRCAASRSRAAAWRSRCSASWSKASARRRRSAASTSSRWAASARTTVALAKARKAFRLASPGPTASSPFASPTSNLRRTPSGHGAPPYQQMASRADSRRAPRATGTGARYQRCRGGAGTRMVGLTRMNSPGSRSSGGRCRKASSSWVAWWTCLACS
jgi:hypothetical protein